MIVKILHFLVGFISGGMIFGGIISRLWSGRWGGDGFCVIMGALFGAALLISSAVHEDEQ